MSSSSNSPADCRSFYPYTPSLALASVAVGLFTVVTGAHLLRMFLTRTWDSVFFVLGGTCQLAGYIARLYSTQTICSQSAFAAQSFLLLVGPTLMMFSVVLTQTQFLKVLGADRFCWVPLRWQRPIYLLLNTAFIIVQAIGGAYMASGLSHEVAETGSKRKVAAYVMQMVFWGFILAENTWSTFKLGKALEKANSSELATLAFERSTLTIKERFPRWKWWNQLFGLAISIIGFGRNLMRLTELGVSFLQDNEWPGYAFDGYQMVVVMGAWAVFYLPGKCAQVERVQYRYRDLGMEVLEN